MLDGGEGGGVALHGARGGFELAGGVFGLFTAEDIKSASGKTLIKKGRKNYGSYY